MLVRIQDYFGRARLFIVTPGAVSLIRLAETFRLLRCSPASSSLPYTSLTRLQHSAEWYCLYLKDLLQAKDEKKLLFALSIVFPSNYTTSAAMHAFSVSAAVLLSILGAAQASVIEHWWNITWVDANPDGVSSTYFSGRFHS
jgi:hypothetical protein